MKQIEVSKATFGRIPAYIKYLEGICDTTPNISATVLAKAMGLGEVQVRKDLSSISGAGKPKIGYVTSDLLDVLKHYVKPENNGSVIIVGAGKLGCALLDYGGFGDYGLKISAAFDISVDKPKKSKTGKPIYSLEYLDKFCSENTVKIGVIAVPAVSAQSVCDMLVKNRVSAIWCFAPCALKVPDNLLVQYENMALSLAYLNNKIK